MALLVSIHAPREGCDATNDALKLAKSVSIHAPREGCDSKPATDGAVVRSFNSRTPGGVRLLALMYGCLHPMFQFTHPGRGATGLGHIPPVLQGVSIHAPREGCDWCFWFFRFLWSCFNSRTPGGVRRPVPLHPDGGGGCFNSRTPGGVRQRAAPSVHSTHRFNSRTPGGVRPRAL